MIAKAKAEDRYMGRKPTAQAKSQHVLELIDQGMTKTAVAEALEIGLVALIEY